MELSPWRRGGQVMHSIEANQLSGKYRLEISRINYNMSILTNTKFIIPNPPGLLLFGEMLDGK
jgi:hypothetical protein